MWGNWSCYSFPNVFIFIAVLSLFWFSPFLEELEMRGGVPLLEKQVIWLWNLSRQKPGDLNLFHQQPGVMEHDLCKATVIVFSFQLVTGKVRMVIFIYLIEEGDSFKNGFYSVKQMYFACMLCAIGWQWFWHQWEIPAFWGGGGIFRLLVIEQKLWEAAAGF